MSLTLLKEWLIYFIAANRKSFFIRSLARCASAFTKGYENFSFNIKLNGEARVMETLSSASLKTVFDVGANHGKWTITAKDYFKEAEFHCFELVPKTFDIMKQNLSNLTNVHLNRFGLSNEEGIVEISYAIGHDTHSSLVAPSTKGEFVKENAPVKIGSQYVKEKNIEHIDFLKIDTEGAEHLVLDGFRATLAEGNITAIQFEYGRTNVGTHFCLLDFYKLFESAGYVVGKIYPNYVNFCSYSNNADDFIGPNYLAVKKTETELISKLAGN